MWDEQIERYAWADLGEDERLQNFTVAVIVGRSEDEVIRAFGGDPASSRTMVFADALDESYKASDPDLELLQTLSVGRHVVTLEGSYRGSVPEVARRATASGGQFHSIYSDVNGGLQVLHATDGRLDGLLKDPSWIEDAPFMDDAPEIPAWAEGAPFTLETARSVSFALMERLMGVAFDLDWLDAALRTVQLAPISTLFPDLDAAFAVE